MEISILFFSFVFGALIGSFLNVVIYRFQTGVGYGGRSFCMNCRKQLHAHELIPIFSFLFQKGKCTKCQTTISPQYPIVELATALASTYFASLLIPVLYNGAPWFIPVGLFVLLMSIFSVMLVIVVYDIRHKNIPDKLIYSLGFVVVLYRAVLLFFGQAIMLSDLLGAITVPFLFWALWRLSHGRAIGLGDAKLMIPIGFLLGLEQSLIAIMFAFWVGAVFSIVTLIFKQVTKKTNWTMKTEVPFAPFIVLGTLLVYFLQITLVDIVRWFSFA